MASSEYRGLWLPGERGIAALSGPWQDLFDATSSATPYQHPSWLSAWATRLPPGTEPVVVMVTDRVGRPAAALALAYRHGGAPSLTALSSPVAECVTPVGPGADDPDVTAVLARVLSAMGSRARLVLRDVPASSAFYWALVEYGGVWDEVVAVPYAVTRLPLPEDDAALSAATRRTHRRGRRDWTRMANDGRVTYERTDSPPALLAALPDLLRMHSERWPHSRMPTLPWAAVLRECAELASIARLSLDGVTIAAQLVLHQGEQLYSLLPAWDVRYRALSPGHALLRALSDEAGALGVGFRRLHLGRTLPEQVDYKNAYAPEWRTAMTLAARPADGWQDVDGI